MADAKKQRIAYTRRWKAATRHLQSSVDQSHSSSSDEDMEHYVALGDVLNKDTTVQSSKSASCQESSEPEVELSDEDDRSLWDGIDEMNNTVMSSDEELDNEDPAESLRDDLVTWINSDAIKHCHVDNLLKILRNHGHDLPATARTLLKTPQNINIGNKSGMEYIFLGVKDQLVKNFALYPDQVRRTIETLHISLNIDGLPLFKSSKKTLWPILCSINLTPKRIFPLALTCGDSKPCNQDYLRDCITEMDDILRNGLVADERTIHVALQAVICDSPARAMVKAIKQFSGYYGCERCDQKGYWLQRMTFQETEGLSLRTDQTFRRQVQEEHHRGISIFCELPIDMVKSFPLDYMHLLCLGVMKRLILVWMRGKKPSRLSHTCVSEVSERLVNLRHSIPDCFARKPRSLEDIDRWKATELRQFLLYTGQLVLKGILNDDLYDHFMTLSVAACILISPSLVSDETLVGYAENLLLYFVRESRNLYSPEFLIYNVHGLLHLVEDVRTFGSLDNISAFPFESYLHDIKRHVRSGKNPLIQVVKRLREKENCSLVLGSPHPIACVQFQAPNNAYIISNNCCCETLCETAESDDAGTRIQCRVYERLDCNAAHPVDSRLIGVFRGSIRHTRIKVISRRKLKERAIRVAFNGGKVIFIAILHDFHS